MTEAPRTVALGRVVNTHGVRGELRLLPYNPATEILRAGALVSLGHRGTTTPTRLASARPHRNFILVTFEGVDSMAAAEEWIGAEVLVAADELPAPRPGEAYHFQLVGLTVQTAAGETVGVVHEMFTTPAHDVCAVRREGREILIPWVPEIVREVDLEGGRIVIEPLPGLLDE
jgi:16S rRNA processing protein RimM